MINFIKMWNFIKSFLSPKKKFERDRIQVDGNKNITIINIYNNYSNENDIKSSYNKNKNKQ